MPALRQSVKLGAKATRQILAWPYRQATSRNRSLPHFIIIGAQKSGTTSLFNYLCQHPSVRRGFIKEVHFFDGGTDSGW